MMKFIFSFMNILYSRRDFRIIGPIKILMETFPLSPNNFFKKMMVKPLLKTDRTPRKRAGRYEIPERQLSFSFCL